MRRSETPKRIHVPNRKLTSQTDKKELEGFSLLRLISSLRVTEEIASS